MSKSIIAIGDIHGCANTLKTLWDKLESYKDSLHVFIGDYIDRGPSSKAVVDFLLEARHERNCIFLRGNHEQMLLNALHKHETTNWLINGGNATLKSYNHSRDLSRLPEEHIAFYEETLPYYESEDYFFVHAGIPPHQTIESSKKDPDSGYFFLWGREHLNAFETPWEKTVVFGHTPRPHPIKKANMIGIDTGCVYNKPGYGRLTAVILPETAFIHQLSLD